MRRKSKRSLSYFIHVHVSAISVQTRGELFLVTDCKQMARFAIANAHNLPLKENVK